MKPLSQPLPVLRLDFLNYLKERKRTEFSTKNVMEWYEYRMFKLEKEYNKNTAYAAVHRQVIYQLLLEGKIKRTSRGIYEVITGEKVKETVTQNHVGSVAEEKWARLSGKGFNPDSMLTEETLGRIKK